MYRILNKNHFPFSKLGFDLKTLKSTYFWHIANILVDVQFKVLNMTKG